MVYAHLSTGEIAFEMHCQAKAKGENPEKLIESSALKDYVLLDKLPLAKFNCRGKFCL